MRRLGLLLTLMALAWTLSTTGCDDSPAPLDSGIDPTLPQAPPPPPPSDPTARGVIETEGGMLADLRRRANAGEISAMLTLARAYQSRDNERDQAEARAWYQRAADAGDSSAQLALREWEARAAARPSDGTQPTAEEDFAYSDEATAFGSAGATTAPTTTAAPPALPTTLPADPTQLRWQDIRALLSDEEDFVTGESRTRDGQFAGVITARDKRLTVVAIGPEPDRLQAVRAIIRIRSHQEPNSSPRVGQVAALAAMVTRNNVSRNEMGDWVTAYVRNGRSTEPMFRNGWRVLVGQAGDGTQRDRHEFLGVPVMVELKL